MIDPQDQVSHSGKINDIINNYKMRLSINWRIMEIEEVLEAFQWNDSNSRLPFTFQTDFSGTFFSVI